MVRLLPYSGKLSREKELVKNTIFLEKLSRIAHFCCAKGYYTPKFHGENFRE